MNEWLLTNPPGDALLMHPPISQWGRASDRTLFTFSGAAVFSLSARRWWYEVVVLVVTVASCSSLLPPHHPVTADLLGWFSAIWRYTKSHYSVGHGLDRRGADQRGSAFTSCFLGRQKMENEEQRGEAEGRGCVWPLNRHFFSFLFFFFASQLRRKHR